MLFDNQVNEKGEIFLDTKRNKVLLAAINAKYIHSNLAVYSLCAYAKVHGSGRTETDIAEYTINQLPNDILQDIYRHRPDMVCFSCYIWNIEYIKELIGELNKILPKCSIWLGGPEVSYRAKEFLEQFVMVKGVMKGEGEETFTQLLESFAVSRDVQNENIEDKAWEDKRGEYERGEYKRGEYEKTESLWDKILQGIEGITYREKTGVIRENPFRAPLNLDDIPFVYHDLKPFQNKIIYYESSRGCPFSCSYCLSSIDKKLRFRSLEKVKKELQFFLDAKIPQVKFVDRTFNCNHKHALEIWKYLLEHDNGITNFHFEVSADLLNAQELQVLRRMRKGLVQLEIGVQSTNAQTIQEIHRTMDVEKLGAVVKQIKESGNIHQHLDLIAGLPWEDYSSFANSFNQVYAMKPEQLQLGFLKVLSGSYMQEHRQDYGLVCKDKPPYEVLYTNWLSYEEVMRLKGVEEVVEIYYNSGQFTYTIKELEKYYETPFQMYEKLSRYYENNYEKSVKHSRISRYEILLDFIKEELQEPKLAKAKLWESQELQLKQAEQWENGKVQQEVFRQLLILDLYLRENVKNRPAFAPNQDAYKEAIRILLQREAEAPKYLSGYEEYNYRQIFNMTHVEVFDYNLLEKLEKKKIFCLFDYKNRDVFHNQAQVFVIEEDEH